MQTGTTGPHSGFGSAIPVYPATTERTRCPRGHLLEVGGVTVSYSHYYALHASGCDICDRLGYSRHERPFGVWCDVDPADQRDASTAPRIGLALVRVPPTVRAGVGRIELRLNSQPVGDVDIVLCPIEKRAVFEHVRVDVEHRRLGYGRTLVAAALTLGTGYDWSMTAIDSNSIEAKAFWASVGLPGPTNPAYCSHMQQAAGMPFDA